VSTSTLGGHVSPIPEQHSEGRRRRRVHTDEFKADAVAACQQHGMSMAAVAMSRGINANLLRRWVRLAESPATMTMSAQNAATVRPATAPPAFVPLQLSAPVPSQAAINVELCRGNTTIKVSWPAHAAADCAAWMRELLR
jgi:transposase